MFDVTDISSETRWHCAKPAAWMIAHHSVRRRRIPTSPFPPTNSRTDRVRVSESLSVAGGHAVCTAPALKHFYSKVADVQAEQLADGDVATSPSSWAGAQLDEGAVVGDENVSTPPRRKSVINMFTTPPLRRVLFSRSKIPSGDAPSSSYQDCPVTKTAASATDDDSDDDSDDDDENTLTATGDISLSYPYWVPGASGALSPGPKPKSRGGGTPTLRAQLLQRPRPPVRRIASDTYKFRTLTLKGGCSTSTSTPAGTPGRAALRSNATTKPRSSQVVETIRTRPPTVLSTPARHPGDASISSFCGTIRSIEDEDPQLSTPQSRFEAFMKSRDLACSPKKQAAAVAPSAVPARPNTRPLRGNARLPARLPIPSWGDMDVDDE
ncbi:hypothetical protein B0H14DRAFT_3505635 [Mycena olivaceomarginata]|nr:hypothetical protein B0H14DRAFT_3505635 [Mycena olivaceomarginata]